MKISVKHCSLIVVLLVCIFSLNICLADEQIATYRNERFNFKVNIPRWLRIKEPRPANGDGLTFVNERRGLEVRAYGVNNVLNRTAFQEASSGIETESFDVLYDLPQKAAVSWRENDKIIWKKALLIKDSSGDMGHFVIVYAASDINNAPNNEEAVLSILKTLAPL